MGLGKKIGSLLGLGRGKKNYFKILSFDGGGIKGAFPASLMCELIKETPKPLSEKFDLIVGTSTGSILASALATDFPIDEVLNMYEDKGCEIFKEKKTSLKGIRRSKYSKECLIKQAEGALGELTMDETKTDLLITATQIGNGNPTTFNKNYKDVKVSDAVIASCSAPVLFKPHKINDELFVDGGVWANNPALLGIVEAVTKYEQKLEDIILISIGTGEDKSKYFPNNKYDKKDKWGILKWNTRLISLILQTSKLYVNDMCNSLLNKKNYLRLEFTSKKPLPSDDPMIVPVLKKLGRRVYRKNAKKLRKLVEA
jgi:hypothetical protein